MMRIETAGHSRVPGMVRYLGGWVTAETVVAALALGEAGFYASVRGSAQESNRVVKWIRAGAVARFHGIQRGFNVAQTVVLGLLLFRELVEGPIGRFHSAVRAGMMLAVGAGIVRGFSKWMSKKPITEDLHAMKWMVNAGLCVGSPRLGWAVGLIGSGYSWFKNARLQWMPSSTTIPLQVRRIPEAKSADVTYKMLALEPEATTEESSCPICLENEGADMVFCTNNHPFHKDCIGQWVESNKQKFLEGAYFHKDTEMSAGGVILKVQYDVTLQEEALPFCPSCNEVPRQNTCDVLVHDTKVGSRQAAVSIQRKEDDQALFEKVYAVYNVVQATLACLQQYSELAVGIYQIQQLMLLTDMMGLLGTLYYLEKRYGEQQKEQAQWRSFLKEVAAVAAAGVSSYVGVLLLNRALCSPLVLNDILAQQGIDVQWGCAQRQQTLHLMRLIASVALGWFSKHRSLSVWGIAAQTISFAALARLKWVVYTRTWTGYPLWSNRTLSELTMEASFLVDPSCTKEAHHMRSALNAIYDRMSHMLDLSRWQWGWKISRFNGAETSRTRYYHVALRNILAIPCECTLTPGLANLSMRGIDVQYGKVEVSEFK